MFKNTDYSIILPTLNEYGHIKDLISEISNIIIIKIYTKINFKKVITQNIKYSFINIFNNK